MNLSDAPSGLSTCFYRDNHLLPPGWIIFHAMSTAVSFSSPPHPFLNRHLYKPGIFTGFFSPSRAPGLGRPVEWRAWEWRGSGFLASVGSKNLATMRADWAKWWAVGALLNLTWGCRYTAVWWQFPQISLESPAEEGIHNRIIIHHNPSHFSHPEVTPRILISLI